MLNSIEMISRFCRFRCVDVDFHCEEISTSYYITTQQRFVIKDRFMLFFYPASPSSLWNIIPPKYKMVVLCIGSILSLKLLSEVSICVLRFTACLGCWL